MRYKMLKGYGLPILFFIISFLFIVNLAAWAGVIGEEMLKYLTEGLEGYNLTLKELTFDKKWVRDDTFRLNVITQLMDEPLHAPDFALTQAAFCDSLTPYALAKFIIHNAYLLDAPITPRKDDNTKTSVNFKTRKLPRLLNNAVAVILLSFERAEPYLKKSYSMFTKEQLERLLVNAPVIWSDEDDSLEADSLKGILYKELALPFDTTSFSSDTVLLKYIKHFDRTSLFMASAIVAEGVEKALQMLKGVDVNNIGSGILLDTLTAFGRIAIGGRNDDIYQGEYALLIDLGGDDRYKGRFASGIGILHQPFSVLIDLSGNDIYSSRRVFNIGAGLLGCGILVDLEGNDDYRGFHNSIGAGLFGVGMVIDNAGNDFYDAGYFSEAAGLVGQGLLFDGGGRDVFKGFDWTQGFGSTFGSGSLIDKGGNDVYTAGGRYIHHPLLPHDYRSFAQGFGMGFRPDAGGGIGFLYDTEGNDFYNAEVFAQGASYWYSLGMLFDRKGNDYYNACEYAQGAGIHLSIGVLIDEGGNDHYFSRLGPSQGEGHDLSVGILIDKKGNDSYVVSGGQGIGLTNSCGIFIDCEGNDLYASSEKLGEGSANPSRGFGGLGAFIDMGGNDFYPKSRAGMDESIWIDGDYGVGMDVKSSRKPREEEFPQKDTLAGDAPVDKVFKIASMWEVAENKTRVRNARERLKKMGMVAIKYIIDNKIATKSGLEMRAVNELAKAYPDSIEPFLINLISDKNLYKRANAIWLLGEIKSKKSVESLITVLKEKRNQRLKNTIINALGEIGERKASDVIVPYLTDKNERVRITSARALGRIKDNTTIASLLDGFKDEFFTVRLACENSIVAFGDTAAEPLLNALKKADDDHQIFHIISALGRIVAKEDSVSKRTERLKVTGALIPFLDSKENFLRAQAVKALSLFKDKNTTELLKNKRLYETDSFVIGVYRKYLKGEQ